METGHADFGEQNGKKVVAIQHNEDGTMDITTEDGVIYRGCYLKSYEYPANENVQVETIKFNNVKIYRENVLKAFGLEEQDLFGAKMQEKTIDSVD